MTTPNVGEGTHRGVPITMDKERMLRYDTNSLVLVEEHLGVGLGGLVFSGKIGIKMLRAFLWAGLRWEDSKLSPKEAGVLMDLYYKNGGSHERLGEAVERALALAGFGKSEDEGGGDEGKQGDRPFASEPSVTG